MRVRLRLYRPTDIFSEADLSISFSYAQRTAIPVLQANKLNS
eukprot:SAG31_NODE_47994_length_202_cov_1.611650_1_plen_41_part_10